jgi:hypothetical protein
VEVLKRHVRRQAEEKMKLESLYRDEGLVFASGIGTPLDAQNIVNRSYKPLLESAGLPSNRFHDLRHTCATLLLAKAIHPKFVQALLGSSVFKFSAKSSPQAASSRSNMSFLNTASETRLLRHRIASLCVLPSATFLR